MNLPLSKCQDHHDEQERCRDSDWPPDEGRPEPADEQHAQCAKANVLRFHAGTLPQRSAL